MGGTPSAHSSDYNVCNVLEEALEKSTGNREGHWEPLIFGLAVAFSQILFSLCSWNSPHCHSVLYCPEIMLSKGEVLFDGLPCLAIWFTE